MLNLQPEIFLCFEELFQRDHHKVIARAAKGPESAFSAALPRD